MTGYVMRAPGMDRPMTRDEEDDHLLRRLEVFDVVHAARPATVGAARRLASLQLVEIEVGSETAFEALLVRLSPQLRRERSRAGGGAA